MGSGVSAFLLMPIRTFTCCGELQCSLPYTGCTPRDYLRQHCSHGNILAANLSRAINAAFPFTRTAIYRASFQHLNCVKIPV